MVRKGTLYFERRDYVYGGYERGEEDYGGRGGYYWWDWGVGMNGPCYGSGSKDWAELCSSWCLRALVGGFGWARTWALVHMHNLREGNLR